MRRIGLAVVVAIGFILVAFVAEPQKPSSRPPRIGTLSAFSPPSQPDWQQRSPFWGALRELGWIEGQNIMVERRWAEGRLDRLPALAIELVQLKVDLILANAGAEISAAKRATRTIPIVMASSLDAVEQGFVDSLARPGGDLCAGIREDDVHLQSDQFSGERGQAIEPPFCPPTLNHDVLSLNPAQFAHRAPEGRSLLPIGLRGRGKG